MPYVIHFGPKGARGEINVCLLIAGCLHVFLEMTLLQSLTIHSRFSLAQLDLADPLLRQSTLASPNLTSPFYAT